MTRPCRQRKGNRPGGVDGKATTCDHYFCGRECSPIIAPPGDLNSLSTALLSGRENEWRGKAFGSPLTTSKAERTRPRHACQSKG